MANKRSLIVLASIMVCMTAKAEEAPRIPIPPNIESEVKALGCDSCHGWTRTKFGPAWQDVADRYRGRTNYVYRGFNIDGPGETFPLMEGLVKKVSKGGK